MICRFHVEPQTPNVRVFLLEGEPPPSETRERSQTS